MKKIVAWKNNAWIFRGLKPHCIPFAFLLFRYLKHWSIISLCVFVIFISFRSSLCHKTLEGCICLMDSRVDTDFLRFHLFAVTKRTGVRHGLIHHLKPKDARLLVSAEFMAWFSSNVFFWTEICRIQFVYFFVSYNDTHKAGHNTEALKFSRMFFVFSGGYES